MNLNTLRIKIAEEVRDFELTAVAQTATLDRWINEAYHLTENLVPYSQELFKVASDSRVDNQRGYDMPSDFRRFVDLRIEDSPYRHIEWFDKDEYISSGNIEAFYIDPQLDKFYITPRPDEDAETIVIKGAHATSVTTLSADDVSNLPLQGRIKVSGEVVVYDYADVDTNELKFCTRESEGTTATALTGEEVATHRDIVYSYAYNLIDLTATADVPVFPSNYHYSIVEWSKKKYWESMGDNESLVLAKTAETNFYRIIESYKRDMDTQTSDDADQMRLDDRAYTT